MLSHHNDLQGLLIANNSNNMEGTDHLNPQFAVNSPMPNVDELDEEGPNPISRQATQIPHIINVAEGINGNDEHDVIVEADSDLENGQPHEQSN